MPYLVAGAETVYGTFHKYVKKEDSWQFKLIHKFIEKTDSGYLFSFGNGLSNSKNNKRVKIKNSYAKSFSKFFKKETFIENCEKYDIKNIVMDSGGYQAQSGYLDLKKCYEFIEEYNKFILENHEKFRYFFALDLIPDGLSYEELVALNTKSFETHNALPDEIKKKMIFIYHFFTPKVHKAWHEITDKYFDKFSDYFAFGGLAAKDTVGVKLPIAVFSIGIVKIVHNAKLRGIKKLKIHILGAASYRDIMLYQLYKVIIRTYHDVDLDITYDSSLPFKQIQKSRCVNIIEDDYTNNLLSIRESDLGLYIERYINGKSNYITVENLVKEKMVEMAKDIAPEYIDIIKNVPIYELKADKSGNGLGKDFGLLCILFSSWQYHRLEEQCFQYILSMMDTLKNNPFQFYDVINDLLLKLNAGKLSYKFKDKVKYVRSTVECLIDLNTDYIDEIVDTFLLQSEIVDMQVEDDIKPSWIDELQLGADA